MDDDDLNDYENDDFFEDDENDETYSTSTDASTDVAEKKPMNQRKVRNVIFEFKILNLYYFLKKAYRYLIDNLNFIEVLLVDSKQ